MNCPVHHGAGRPTATTTANKSLPPAPGPKSLMWKEISDSLFMSTFFSPLLMEVAHPDVGTAIAQHSDVHDDPWGRANRTFSALARLIHGGKAGTLAHRDAENIRELHRNIKGQHPDGSKYFALSPQAYRIVPDTLLDHLINYRNIMGRPYSPAEKQQLYQEYRQLCFMLGLREQDIEPDLDSFYLYYKKLTTEKLTYNDSVKVLLDETLAQLPKPTWLMMGKGVWEKWQTRKLRPIVRLLTIGFFNPEYRVATGVPWSSADQRAFDKLIAKMRRIYRYTPRTLRTQPYAVLISLGFKATPIVTWAQLKNKRLIASTK